MHSDKTSHSQLIGPKFESIYCCLKLGKFHSVPTASVHTYVSIDSGGIILMDSEEQIGLVQQLQRGWKLPIDV